MKENYQLIICDVELTNDENQTYFYTPNEIQADLAENEFYSSVGKILGDKFEKSGKQIKSLKIENRSFDTITELNIFRSN